MAEKTPLSVTELGLGLGASDREFGPFVRVEPGESYDHSIIRINGELSVQARTAHIARAAAVITPAPTQAPAEPSGSA